MATCCPRTFTDFCLADGTPIGITIDNGAIVSWVNLITGVVTPGPPPAGTEICPTGGGDPLDCLTDSVAVCQETSPWVIGDGGGSITVDAIDFDIRNLVFATDKVDVSGSTGVGVTGPLTDVQLRATPPPVDPVDDYDTFEAQHVVLVASTDTTITFSSAARLVRISNWDILNRILVKDGAITSDGDTTAARVGKAPASDVPGQMYFPFATTTVHIRSAAGSEVTIEGYKGSV